MDEQKHAVAGERIWKGFSRLFAIKTIFYPQGKKNSKYKHAWNLVAFKIKMSKIYIIKTICQNIQKISKIF